MKHSLTLWRERRNYVSLSRTMNQVSEISESDKLICKVKFRNNIFHGCLDTSCTLQKPNSWTYNFVEVSGHNFEFDSRLGTTGRSFPLSHKRWGDREWPRRMYCMNDPGTHPSLPPHKGSYTMALLVSQDRRVLFVTPWYIPTSVYYLKISYHGV